MDQDSILPEHVIRPVSPEKLSFDGTISSPSLSPNPTSRLVSRDHSQPPASLNTSQLTPPTSPQLLRPNTDCENPPSASQPRSYSKPSSCTSSGDDLPRKGIPAIIECPFEVRLLHDLSGRPQLLGQGAWSKVFRATAELKYPPPPPSPTTSSIPTPPSSPETSSSIPVLVAVKTPLSTMSHKILQNEALILSHLTRTPDHEKYIVQFYGYLSPSVSLVLASVPLPLSHYIKSRAQSTPVDPSDHAPILGSIPIWLSLAHKLISSLAWLHETAEVVHGDIKPDNVLISPIRTSDAFPFDPLLIDFSSSHLLRSRGEQPNGNGNGNDNHGLSALTREYTAPELLCPSVLRDASATATTASDVFSLAVTLLVAATGELMVYPGNRWQRQYMATQGWNVVEFVRSGEGGGRVPGGGVVERAVERAVRRGGEGEGRIEVGVWRDLVGGLF